jgi:hypothetical protein
LVARIALRIDGDGQHLHALRVAPSCWHRRHLHHGSGANIGTLRIAEEHHHHLPRKSASVLAAMVGQAKILAAVGAGNIGVLESGLRRGAADQRKRE